MSPKLLLINVGLPAGRPGVAGVATMEPLGLAYVAAMTPADWDVEIVDEVAGDRPRGPAPDLVGITALTPTAPRAYAVAAEWRRRGVPTVLGGMHATFCPDEAADYVDAVFCGEAEAGWPAVIADFAAGRLARRYDAGVAVLAAAPAPRRDLYRHRYRVGLISASRGCRHRCEFCAIWKFDAGRYRTRPVAAVLDELAGLPASPVLLFTDDNIYTDRDHALALFRGMRERRRSRRFAVQASLDIADDDELLAAIRAAGGFAVLVGLESVNEATLRTMRKGVNLRVGVAGYRDKIRQIHRHGLLLAGTFIFAGDGDEADIFTRTADFVLDAGIDLAHFGLLAPMPGTDVFARLGREGRLLRTDYPADYALLDLSHAVFQPQGMTPAQAEAGLAEAIERVGALPVALRRAGRTWRDTGRPFNALVSLLWTRTGLHRRIFAIP